MWGEGGGVDSPSFVPHSKSIVLPSLLCSEPQEADPVGPITQSSSLE